jgi:ubiquinone/menaquinone biosynthesis C-methylase UbiE
VDRPSGAIGWIAERGFAHPRGVLGWLGGRIMARKNAQRARWVVDQLDLTPDCRVIEVGFGPGVAIAEVARRAARVAGVDASGAMLSQARGRNAAAIASGRIDLRLGDAAALPFADATFDRAFAVNTSPFWADRGGGLREAARVLRPGGLVAIAWQPLRATDADGLRRIGDDLVGALREAGFLEVRVVQGGPPTPAPVVCALGVKPAGDDSGGS